MGLTRIPRSLQCGGALLCASLLVISASAQSDNRSTMVMDDGQTRRVLSYAEPDVSLVVQPEVTRADIPLFERYLRLSEAQRAVVDREIGKYLDAIAKLARSSKLEEDASSPMRRGPQRMRRGGDDDGGYENQRGGQAGPPEQQQNDARDAISNIILDAMRGEGIVANSIDDLPVRPRIEVGMTMEDTGESDQPPTPTVNVTLSFGGEDDSISEEMREKLQRVADKAVPLITEHVRNQRAEMIGGPGPGGEVAGIDARWAQVQALRQRVAEFDDENDKLLAALVEAVQRILSDEQLGWWPQLEQALTRRHTLPWGRLDGEQLDLFDVVDQLELTLTQRDALKQALADYAQQLHSALTNRNDLIEGLDEKVDTALYEGRTERALNLIDRAIRSRVNVRSVNERAIENLAVQLDESSGEALRRLAKSQASPRAFAVTTGQRAFDKLFELDDLTDEQRAAANEIHTGYRVSLAQINNRIYRTIRSEQSRQLRQEIERVVATMHGEAGGGATHDQLESQREITDQFQRRRQLDVRTMRALYSLLTPQQVERLPRIPQVDVDQQIISEHVDDDGDGQ